MKYPFSLSPVTATLHGSARRVSEDRVETAPECWAYAVTFPIPPKQARRNLCVTARIEVSSGRIGVGLLNAAEDAFIVERFADASSVIEAVTLRAGGDGPPSRIVFRNASSDGASRFRIVDVSLWRERGAYPVSLAPRIPAAEPIPTGGGVIVFNDEAAAAINRARIDFIRSLGVSFAGLRVLDLGCGVGHFAQMYSSLGASVVAVDGREDNVREMARLYPAIEGRVGDVQTMDLGVLGSFDVVHAFGLLYHLDSPVAALRRMERVCRRLLLVETIVCDSAQPLMILADETMSVNQALAGIGCRPSPSFVAMAMNRIGFPYVYGAAKPLDHPDFQFAWRNSLETARDGHNLRAVFVASREPVRSDALVMLVEP